MLGQNVRLFSACILTILTILFDPSIARAANITIGETNVLSLGDDGNANLLLAQNAVLSQPATIVSLSFYVAAASGNLRLGIYDATGPGGGPGALVAQTNSFKTVKGWNTSNVIKPVLLPAGKYWLSYLPSSNNLAFVKGSTPGTGLVYYGYNFGSMPAAYSKSPNSDPTYHWSFYATLTPSSQPAAQPAATAPAAPTGVTGSAASSSQINLTWATASNATGYSVFRNGAQVGTTTGTSYSDTGLAAGTTYTYAVVASNSAGSSPQSSSISVTTPAAQPVATVPAAPTGLTGNAASSSQINLTWAAVSNATGYSVFRNGAQVGTMTSTSYSNTGLAAATTYTYAVVASNTAGSSPQSSSVSVTTQAAQPVATVPAAPTGLTGSAASSSQINLTWTAVSNATGYSVFQNGAQIGTTTSASYSSTGLAAATAYTYSVVASNTAGSSPQSSSISVTTLAALINGACGSSNGATLSSAPTTNLCSAGSATTISGSGPWSWSCLGSNGGGTATCRASSSSPSSGFIPSDRLTAWNPGLTAAGGIPTRTQVCATVNASTYGNGTSDASSGIQAAIEACPAGQVVMLSSGTFAVNNAVLIDRGITLRGQGAGVTILNKTNGAKGRTSQVIAGTGVLTPVDPSTYSYDTQPIIIIGPSRWPSYDDSTAVNLTADAAKGAYSVTVSNAAGFAAGQFVLLDETSGASWQPVPAGFGCTDSAQSTPCPPLVWQGDRVAWNMHYPQQMWQDDNGASNASGPYDTTPGVPPNAMSWFSRTDRPTNEIKEVSSVSGNTVTFTTPMHISYRTANTAQLVRSTATGSQSGGNSVHVTGAGVENLTVRGGADGQIRFEHAAYSWAKGIENTQWIGEGFAVNGSFRIEIRGSYIYQGSWPQPGGAGYAISFADGTSEVLVEDNIVMDTCKIMVVRSSGAGSVFAYNYTDDSWDFDNPGWVEVGLNASHMAGPHHVLFEGNYAQNVDSDYTHGNAIYLTFFRNWLSGQRKSFTDSSNIRTVGLAYGSWWDSVAGNVLGRPGQMSGWVYDAAPMSGTNANWGGRSIWSIGYDPERWGMYADPKTLSTLIRGGNFDYLTNQVHWESINQQTLPPSLYLPSKPSFFGNYAWPWVDPTGATPLYTLPAKARYEAGTPFAPAPGATQ